MPNRQNVDRQNSCDPPCMQNTEETIAKYAVDANLLPPQMPGVPRTTFLPPPHMRHRVLPQSESPHSISSVFSLPSFPLSGTFPPLPEEITPVYPPLPNGNLTGTVIGGLFYFCNVIYFKCCLMFNYFNYHSTIFCIKGFD